MKKTILFVSLFFASLSTFAQYSNDDDKTFKFGLGGAVSLPVGDLKQSATYGVGFEAIGVYSISDNIDAFAQAGVHVFKSTAAGYYGDAANILHIPLMVGARFKTDGFFAGAGIGYGLFHVSGGDGLSGFLYSPQVGYDFGKIQVLANYTASAVSGGTLAYFGLKVFRTF
jgi:hypothetical protein